MFQSFFLKWESGGVDIVVLAIAITSNGNENAQCILSFPNNFKLYRNAAGGVNGKSIGNGNDKVNANEHDNGNGKQ